MNQLLAVRNLLTGVVNIERYTFAECSDTEFIMTSIKDALALIDAELALHSTAEIAGTRAGEVCIWVEAPHTDPTHFICGCNHGHFANMSRFCPDCGKRVELN